MGKEQKEKLELILLSVITLLLVGLLVFSAVRFKMEQKANSDQDKNQSHEKEDTDKEESVPTEIPEISSPPGLSTPLPTPSIPSSSSETPSLSDDKNEENVISYFSSLEASSFQSQDVRFVEQAKNAFTTVVDFLFFGSEIKGYTFSELTTSAKLKVIQIALSIDHKIDAYFPDYKESIKIKTTDLKAQAALLYLEQTAKLCDTVGEEACNEARRDFKNMKESFGFTWDMIKDGASQGYSYLKEVLNEWYQSIK